MPEKLLIIRTGMAAEDSVSWVGADQAHAAIGRLLDRRLAGRIQGAAIDALNDEIMELLMALPKAVRDA